MHEMDVSIFLEMASNADNAREAGFPRIAIAPDDLIALVLDACQMRAALVELVRLKAIKDDPAITEIDDPRTRDYESNKPKAWAEARRMIERATHATLDGRHDPAAGGGK